MEPPLMPEQKELRIAFQYLIREGKSVNLIEYPVPT